MRLLSLRLTHKITAIGVIGVVGVVLIGGIHLYGEKAMGVYRSAAEEARTVFEPQQQDRGRAARSAPGRKGFPAAQRSGQGPTPR